ncbi:MULTISPECIES: relaxase/mobilization nuclease domain-containing protein [Helicobacter]|uniref:MobA/VirD2-like nuclease domain-containing protein n=1 Tax=Helicobacter bilis ATCC 43879 TaxID=613026 RepID=C3XFL8_9HELI|nr:MULTISPECIES: relaxase/mobilization nuclease domain-containing protein [Helicobacter]EEO23807.2 hypothetical protein HRAG_00864 [Helicobacter bilis ATCC 43879]
MSYNPYKQFDLIFKAFEDMQKDKYVFWEDKDTRIQKRYPKIPHEKAKDSYLFFVRRPARHSRQVVVKTLSNLDKRGTYNAISYVIRHSDSSYAIDELGNSVSLKEIMSDWKNDFGTHKNSKDSWHLCFSINEELTDRNIKALQESVKAVLEKHFYAHKYIQVLHTHQNNPHIHVVVNKRNMITHKKLHFKEKSDIRDFFTDIKNDFAIALNFHGLYYSNAQRVERESILSKSSFLDTIGHNDYYKDTIEQLDKDRDRLLKKRDNISKKTDILNDDLKDLQKQRDELQNIIDDIKSKELYFYAEKSKVLKEVEKILTSNKKDKKAIGALFDSIPQYPDKSVMFFALKQIKEISKTIKAKRHEKRLLSKDYNSIDKHIREVEREARYHRQEFSKDTDDKALVTKAKERYLDFILKHKRGATKSQLDVARNIHNQIREEQKALEIHLSMQQQFDNLLLKHFNIHTNSFSLIHACKNLDKKMRILHNMDKYALTDSKIYENYFNTLKENSVVLDKIINEKILHYESILTNEKEWDKYSLNTLNYYHKEFMTLVTYLDNKDYQMSENDKNELKDKIDTYMVKKQAEFKQKQEQHDKLQYYKDFIEWYIQQHKFSSPDYIRKSLTEKAKNNTIEQYFIQYNDSGLLDYMVYLRQKEKEKKDITATQNVSKDTPKELQELPESQLKESKEFYRQFVEWYAKEFDFNDDISLKELYLKRALSGELENSFAKQYNTAIDDFKAYLNKEYGYNIYAKKDTAKDSKTESKTALQNDKDKGIER